MEKQFSLLKPNVAQIALLTTSQKLAFQSVPCTVESHKLSVLAHWRSSRSQTMQHSSQQMLQLAEFTLMEFHSWYTSILHRITRIISTAQVVQLVLANQEQWFLSQRRVNRSQ
jgi:glutamate racemase